MRVTERVKRIGEGQHCTQSADRTKEPHNCLELTLLRHLCDALVLANVIGEKRQSQQFWSGRSWSVVLAMALQPIPRIEVWSIAARKPLLKFDVEICEFCCMFHQLKTIFFNSWSIKVCAVVVDLLCAQWDVKKHYSSHTHSRGPVGKWALTLPKWSCLYHCLQVNRKT